MSEIIWNTYPDTKPSEDSQIEVLFYANDYEWFAGVFTPGGFSANYNEDVFQWHNHQGDDIYHTVPGVRFWIEIPPPVGTTTYKPKGKGQR